MKVTGHLENFIQSIHCRDVQALGILSQARVSDYDPKIIELSVAQGQLDL